MNDVLGHFRLLKDLPTRKNCNVEHVQNHLIYTIINNKLVGHYNYAMETNY
jgi:hypothetical protein